MSSKRYRLLLWSTGILLVIASCAIVGWGFLSPIDSVVVADTQAPRVASAKDSLARLPPISEFQGLWKKRLRRELQETAAPSTPQANSAQLRAKAAAAMGIKLLGTILETGRTMAVFQAAAGRTEFRREGEMIGEPALGVQVLKIEPDRVEIRFQGETLSLELKPKES